ncbi:MAG: serine/threonine protein kinase [Oligoflexales bacterium]
MNAKTHSFFTLTPDKILNSVESLGVKSTGRCLQLNSMENRVYEVELDLSREEEAEVKSRYDRYRVIKFYRPGRWKEEQIQEEHDFLWELKEADIPVVAPLKDDSGRSLFHIKEDDLWFTVFPKVGGRINYESSDSELQILGRALARLHAVGAIKKAKSRIVLNHETYGVRNISFLTQNQFLPLDLESRYQRAAESICELSAKLFEKMDNQRIHGDCHLGNILWGSEGPLWVDFDDMVMGPPVQDVWLMVASQDDDGKRQREVFLNAYEEMGHFDRNSLKLIEPLRTLRYIHYSSWIARRWDDPYFKKSFPHFNTWNYWMEQVGDLEYQLNLIKNEIKS